MNKTALAILAALSASIALADDFKTIEGKEYNNFTVSQQEPCGITLTKPGMIITLYFDELPKDVQERFQYDFEECEKYRAEQKRAADQQNEEQRRQAEENKKKKEKEWAELEKDNQRRKAIKQLVAQINDLQEEKNYLERQITEKESLPAYLRSDRTRSGGSHHWYPNPARSDLRDLKKRLEDVNDALEDAAKQLQQIRQAQR